MGPYTETGSASTVAERAQPEAGSGVDRLQGSGQQPVNQAQDGTWVVVTPVWDGYHRSFYALFSTWGAAYDYWRDRPGSYLCKNLTPV